VTYRERDEQKRAEFIEHIERIIATKGGDAIVYADESGIDHNEVKSKNWSPIGIPTPSHQYGYKYKRTTMIA
jgi:hypothetical protein